MIEEENHEIRLQIIDKIIEFGLSELELHTLAEYLNREVSLVSSHVHWLEKNEYVKVVRDLSGNEFIMSTSISNTYQFERPQKETVKRWMINNKMDLIKSATLLIIGAGISEFFRWLFGR